MELLVLHVLMDIILQLELVLFVQVIVPNVLEPVHVHNVMLDLDLAMELVLLVLLKDVLYVQPIQR